MIPTANGYIYQPHDFAGEADCLDGSRRSLLRMIVIEQGRSCALCREHFEAGDHINLDHVIPVSQGGGHGRRNLQATHVSCNTERGDKPLAGHPLTWTQPALPRHVAPRPCSECVGLRQRVAFLERAQRVLSEDWKRMRAQFEEVTKIVKVPAGRRVTDVLREKLAKKATAQN